MNILVITGFWPSSSNRISGIFILEQVEAYARLGYTVDVIAPVYRRSLFKTTQDFHFKNSKINLYTPRILNMPCRIMTGKFAHSFNRKKFGNVVVKILEQVIKRKSYDGIHIHGIINSGISLPIWAPVVKGPKILTIHGKDPLVQENLKNKWFTKGLRQMSTCLNKITIVGNPLFSLMAEMDINLDKKVQVVHNGVKLPEAVTTAQRPLPEKRIILSVSNLVKLKGVDLNLLALKEILIEDEDLNWEYRIVGDGPEKKLLENKAKELGLDDKVKFLGRLDRDETFNEFRYCDIFCLPSWGEAFGIVYLEAMASGKPAIGCYRNGGEESIIPYKNGLLVQPKNVDSLKVAIRELLSNPELSETMGTFARKYAEGLSWENNVKKYIELFEIVSPDTSAN